MSERHVGSWVRLVLVFAVAFGVCFPVLVAVAFLGFAGARFGWIPSLLAFSALGVGAAWLAVAEHWDMARKRTAIALAVVGALFGVTVAHFAPATPGRLRHEIKGFVQPGWDLRETVTSGNSLCFDYCTSISRTYVVAAGQDEVLESLRPVLVGRGLTETPAFDRERVVFTDRGRGDIDVRIDIEPKGAIRTLVYIRAEAS